MVENNIVKPIDHEERKFEFLRGSILQVLVWPLISLFLGVLIWYLTLTKITNEKNTVEKDALDNASSFAHAYAQHIYGNIEALDQIMLQVKFNWERSDQKQNLEELAQSGVFRSAQIVMVSIIDRNGMPVTSTFASKIKTSSLAGSKHFRFHKNDSSDVLLIGKPSMESMTGKNIITFTRRLNTVDGSFDGLVLISIEASYLTSFYAGAYPGKTGLLAVVGADGTVRSVKIGESDNPVPDVIPLFDSAKGSQFLKGDQGWFGDKSSRFIAWETLEGYPLIVMVGLSEQEFLASHQQTWSTYRQAAGAGSLFLFLFALIAAGLSVRLARKKHQAEEVQKTYRLATEGGNEGYYMYHALRNKNDTIVDFKIVDCNERGADFFGVKKALLLGEKLSTLIPVPFFGELMNIFRNTMESGFYEDEMKVPRESPIKLEWVKRRLVRSGAGLAVTLQDISERKQGEEALRESDQYNRMLFETSPVGLALCDMDGTLIDINPAYARIIGRSIEEAKQLSYWDITPEDYADDEQKQLESLNTTGYYGPYEKEYLHKDGYRVPVRLLGQFIERKGEQYIWSSVEDITEKKASEIALKISNEELEKKVQERTQAFKEAKEDADRANQAKSTFLSRMSHELRTPMNAILGFGQVLEMEINDDQNKAYAQEIITAGHHLLTLINEVLDLSKIESGTLSLSIEDAHLNGIIDECFTIIKPLASKRNIRIINNFPPDTDHVVCVDYPRFKQVLLNLLSNAVKYNRNEGSITINCESVLPQRLRISITDLGMGLSEEQQQQLFKPFERIGAETTAIEGTGIGLVITKNLIEKMGGSIGVKSKLGQGSTFWVETNLGETDGQTFSQPQVQKVPQQLEAKAVSSAKEILYIEDNPANLRLVEQVVRLKTPHTFLSAHDASLGLQMAGSHHPDLILLDINMPGMDGYEVLSKLQANEETHNIPVIAISANAMKSDIQRGVAAGFKVYLTKPIDIEKLLININDTFAE